MSRELLPLVRVDDKNSIAEVVARARGKPSDLTKVMERAKAIVETVREGGDAALLRYSKELDGVDMKASSLRASAGDLDAALERADPKLVEAMRFALKRIQRTQGQLLSRLAFSYVSDGFVVRSVARPLDSVGCYIPGGRAAYASTVLMTAGVAKMAKVKRIAICTPANKEGKVATPILAAARLCGVDEVYKVGGAQAIAALAYGTKSIPRVRKIVGPGGIYVSAAKRLVSGDVPIDFFAGPTEMVVVADSKADARLVAWDLLAQAEHGTDGVSCLITWDEKIAKRVRKLVEGMAPRLERSDLIRATMTKGLAVLCKTRELAIETANAIAPEHIELMVEDPGKMAEVIEDAGLILAGPFSPGAASDYSVGTDHVLPTEGVAKQRAGLTALDFVKVNWIVEGNQQGLRSLLPSLKELALAEGLPNHFLSAQARFRRDAA
jgi:histidinol dehydrogenase